MPGRRDPTGGQGTPSLDRASSSSRRAHRASSQGVNAALSGISYRATRMTTVIRTGGTCRGASISLCRDSGPEWTTNTRGSAKVISSVRRPRAGLAAGLALIGVAAVVGDLAPFRLMAATAERERLTVLCDDRDYLTVAAVTGQAVKLVTDVDATPGMPKHAAGGGCTAWKYRNRCGRGRFPMDGSRTVTCGDGLRRTSCREDGMQEVRGSSPRSSEVKGANSKPEVRYAARRALTARSRLPGSGGLALGQPPPARLGDERAMWRPPAR